MGLTPHNKFALGIAVLTVSIFTLGVLTSLPIPSADVTGCPSASTTSISSSSPIATALEVSISVGPSFITGTITGGSGSYTVIATDNGALVGNVVVNGQTYTLARDFTPGTHSIEVIVTDRATGRTASNSITYTVSATASPTLSPSPRPSISSSPTFRPSPSPSTTSTSTSGAWLIHGAEPAYASCPSSPPLTKSSATTSAIATSIISKSGSLSGGSQSQSAENPLQLKQKQSSSVAELPSASPSAEASAEPLLIAAIHGEIKVPLPVAPVNAPSSQSSPATAKLPDLPDVSQPVQVASDSAPAACHWLIVGWVLNRLHWDQCSGQPTDAVSAVTAQEILPDCPSGWRGWFEGAVLGECQRSGNTTVATKPGVVQDVPITLQSLCFRSPAGQEFVLKSDDVLKYPTMFIGDTNGMHQVQEVSVGDSSNNQSASLVDPSTHKMYSLTVPAASSNESQGNGVNFPGTVSLNGDLLTSTNCGSTIRAMVIPVDSSANYGQFPAVNSQLGIVPQRSYKDTVYLYTNYNTANKSLSLCIGPKSRMICYAATGLTGDPSVANQDWSVTTNQGTLEKKSDGSFVWNGTKLTPIDEGTYAAVPEKDTTSGENYIILNFAPGADGSNQ